MAQAYAATPFILFFPGQKMLGHADRRHTAAKKLATEIMRICCSLVSKRFRFPRSSLVVNGPDVVRFAFLGFYYCLPSPSLLERAYSPHVDTAFRHLNVANADTPMSELVISFAGLRSVMR
jgi:hypothetical protein